MDIRIEAEKRVDAKIKFQENLFKYLVVNTILAIICIVFLQNFWLLIVVMFFWGIGVVDDFFKAYSFTNHREEMIQKEISKIGD